MCPLKKGVRGIEASGSGYLRQQIRGGRKGRAEHHWLGHDRTRRHARRCNRASSDAGPELASREGPAAMESPQTLIAPLERGSGGFNKSSSDDRPGPGICDSKYMEDAKAARSVRVWDRVPIKQQDRRLGRRKRIFFFPRLSLYLQEKLKR